MKTQVFLKSNISDLVGAVSAVSTSLYRFRGIDNEIYPAVKITITGAETKFEPRVAVVTEDNHEDIVVLVKYIEKYLSRDSFRYQYAENRREGNKVEDKNPYARFFKAKLNIRSKCLEEVTSEVARTCEDLLHLVKREKLIVWVYEIKQEDQHYFEVFTYDLGYHEVFSDEWAMTMADFNSKLIYAEKPIFASGRLAEYSFKKERVAAL